MGSEETLDNLGYSLLKDLRFEIGENQTCFNLCFWVFLPSSTPVPSTILHQLHSKNPFLALKEDKRLVLSPSVLLQKESSDSEGISSAKVPCAVSDVEFPLARWAHIGCQVFNNVIRIYLDGKVVGERHLDSSTDRQADLESFTKVTISAVGNGLKCLDGYVHNAVVLPSSTSIEGHHVKDPPMCLCIDSSSVSDIELEGDGIWKVFGGKASCRKMFSSDVLLLNAFGELVDKELEVVASLTYADNRAPVEKSKDDDAPLLTTCNGLEFPSDDKPRKLLRGRASFQLNVCRLSSECDNKMFSIKFHLQKRRNFPFFEAFTPPIRCILKTCDTKISTITWKKLPSGFHLFNGSSLPHYGVGHSELQLQQNPVCEAIPSPPSKRKKLEQDSSLPVTKAESNLQRFDEECSSQTLSVTKNAVGTSLESIQENYGEIDNSGSDSESVGARISELKSIPCIRDLTSDLTIFRYCLGGLSERSLMLKETSLYASEQKMAEMAEKISFFSGCSHHRQQIMIAKILLEEGERAWNLISRNSHRVQWDNVVFEIEEQFMRITGCSTRSLTQQDLNFLRRISGGHEYLTKDNFDKMWRWLYPVAFTISRQGINTLWATMSPKWIEGFFTKEEVEYALQSPVGIQEPGTFILRFPTTRSWPHPDAGSLIASYVGSDFSLHHKQLSLDYSSDIFYSSEKPLQELLLSEPELSRVGRISRSDLTV
ncbi:SH2 domain-containing protein B isoform X1 [Spinacia oleracea]|uniref:SH2 domain-containing protein B isoform X1 n=1 Tax=Spinacia oleracea TaxID=3562 RepID=A0A9R0I4X6_SPIOL|nr:SH2 domain-containing protein B isoform X1 [Spinacia oleracea]XP_021842569.2 SH2 domain-containing protein B isoform X1 [Spinacia oleracea]XP_056699324.1 SH2 domain-containing protein B isoform X1 [Spinacia oleracea]